MSSTTIKNFQIACCHILFKIYLTCIKQIQDGLDGMMVLIYMCLDATLKELNAGVFMDNK